MTDKEKEAIKSCNLLLNGDITLHILDDDGGTAYAGAVNKLYNEDLETVLNLIQTQQAEIEKKDKVIDEMANWIDDRCYYSDNYGNSCEIIQDSCYNNENCNKCIKEYFINKVEKEN